jgi:hypothetical protein
MTFRADVEVDLPTVEGLVRTTLSGKTVLANPDTGDSVTVFQAGQTTEEEVSATLPARNCQDLWMGLSRGSLITSCLVGLFGEIWLTAMRSRTCS